MIRLQLPELQERILDFTPDGVVRVARGPSASTASVTFLAGRIRLGGPVCVPITPSYVEADADLRTFVERESGRFAYHLVHLALTCAAEPEKPRLARATVALEMSSDEGFETPIAWSMIPQRINDPSEVTSGWELAPRLKLTEVEAGLGKVSGGRKRTSNEVYLEALNELRHDPVWEMRRTSTIALRGTQRLVLVVRSPWSALTTVTGTVTGATVHGTILRRERTELPCPFSFGAKF